MVRSPLASVKWQIPATSCLLQASALRQAEVLAPADDNARTPETEPPTQPLHIMRIASPVGAIELVNEPTYSFGSSDNIRRYPLERALADRSLRSSTHGVLLDGEPAAVVSSSGGASTIHEHSGVVEGGSLYIAVGDSVVCMNLRPFEIKWSVQVDAATCFGIYFDARHNALISHGELEIARLSSDGVILWSQSDADIFSEGFSILPGYVEAIDFNGQTYRFGYETGLPADS